MLLVVWVPGILGSRLIRSEGGAVVWPPGPMSEGLLSDRTFAQLTSPDLLEGGVLEAVALCCPVYQPVQTLFDAAGFVAAKAGSTADRQVLNFGFDWRLDIKTTAQRLADSINELCGPNTEIIFLGHSMGGLLSRYMIEAPSLATASFRSKVVTFISMNGPQAGAAVMAARALGIEQTEFIAPADGRKVIAATGYSGGTDLLPMPGQQAVFDGENVIDLYDTTVASYFQLTPNIGVSKTMWDDLAGGNRAPGVKYVIAHSLVDGPQSPNILRYGGGQWTVENADGDGTVTAASATYIKEGTEVILPGTHLGGIQTDEFRDKVFTPYIAPPTVDERFLQTVPQVHLQALRHSVSAGGQITLALVSHPDKAAMTGSLNWFSIDPQGKPTSRIRTQPVQIPTGTTPTFKVTAPSTPGVYRVVLKLGDVATLLNLLATNISVRAADAPSPPPPPTR